MMLTLFEKQPSCFDKSNGDSWRLIIRRKGRFAFVWIVELSKESAEKSEKSSYQTVLPHFFIQYLVTLHAENYSKTISSSPYINCWRFTFLWSDFYQLSIWGRHMKKIPVSNRVWMMFPDLMICIDNSAAVGIRWKGCGFTVNPVPLYSNE